MRSDDLAGRAPFRHEPGFVGFAFDANVLRRGLRSASARGGARSGPRDRRTCAGAELGPLGGGLAEAPGRSGQIRWNVSDDAAVSELIVDRFDKQIFFELYQSASTMGDVVYEAALGGSLEEALLEDEGHGVLRISDSRLWQDQIRACRCSAGMGVRRASDRFLRRSSSSAFFVPLTRSIRGN